MIKNQEEKGARRREKTRQESIVYGKVPPQSVEVEKAILGALMLVSSAYDQVTELIREECFYSNQHQLIFRAIAELNRQNSAIDMMTVIEQVTKNGDIDKVGGSFYISQLTNNVVSDAHIEHHCRIVYQKFLLRELIRFGGEMVHDSYDEAADPFDLMDQFEKDYQQLAMQRTANNISRIDTLLVERMKRVAELGSHDSHLTGIPSGFHHLDRVTHGWQPTDLIILAARPSVGKTALALNLARNAANLGMLNGRKVNALIFSLEMSAGQLVDRLMSSESEVWLDNIMTGQGMDSARLKHLYQKGVQPLASTGLFIDDSAALNVFELRSKARYTIRKYGSPNTDWIIFIDYLQLMSGMQDRKTGNREQEISTISRNLKMLAKELKVPVIALSQLSRAVESRKGEKQVPKLSDLRESGAIEQDADTVMFLYRPEYYDITQNELGESTQGLTEISIAKHRHGSLATGNDAIKLKALLHIQKFVEWDGAPPAESNQFTLPGGNWRPVNENKGDPLPF